MSDSREPVSPVTEVVKKDSRVLSIDALRGFDMFWIIGGDVAARMLLLGDSKSDPDPNAWTTRLADQFVHVTWEGFRFYDLIFPLFLFLVGCVLPYSLRKYAAEPRKVYGRIIRRGLLLTLIGLMLNGLLQLDFANLRYCHVLQRIAIGYVFASILYLHTTWRIQAVVAAAILLGYWALLAFVQAPGGVAGDYSIEGNLAGYVDRALLPGIIWEEYYGYGDNEGILSTIPALAHAVLGLLTGTMLQSGIRPWRKVLCLASAGIACLAVGYAWGQSFPIIKNLWTSSFVLVTTGWSLLLLTFFYAVIDVMGYRRWSLFWIVIGTNAITIYFCQRFINFREVSEFFFGGVARLSGGYEAPIILVGVLVVKWLFLYFLYQRKIFLRV